MVEQSTLDEIDKLVQNSRIFLFMKGNPDSVKCGFSARLVEILEELGVEYQHCDVMQDPKIRQGVKIYSDWPTIPQLYLAGQFIGGCDIVSDMHASGELKKLLDKLLSVS